MNLDDLLPAFARAQSTLPSITSNALETPMGVNRTGILLNSPAWVKFRLHDLKIFGVQMRVDFCSRDALVAKQFLYAAKIRSSPQQVGRKTVTKQVRPDCL